MHNLVTVDLEGHLTWLGVHYKLLKQDQSD